MKATYGLYQDAFGWAAIEIDPKDPEACRDYGKRITVDVPSWGPYSLFELEQEGRLIALQTARARGMLK